MKNTPDSKNVNVGTRARLAFIWTKVCLERFAESFAIIIQNLKEKVQK